jgi:regulator of protease activity HflC (stomatin/prohibitin superfamily)
MPAGFIITIVLTVFTLALAMATLFTTSPETKQVFARITLAFVTFSLIMFAFQCFTQVSTRNIGIVTSFGRPVGVLPNGLHLKLPWHRVTELDGAIQTDSHVGEQKDNNPSPCSTVRLAGQSTACVDSSIRWRIKPEAASTLYKDYRTFENVRDSLVNRELAAALNETFAAYDPLAGLAGARDVPSTSLDTLTSTVTQRLQDKVGSQIEIMSAIIPLIRFDASTEDRIRQHQVALADTRIAVQREETAKAEARINQSLAASVTDAGVLISKCLDQVEAARKSGYGLPAGYSCWPGKDAPLVAVK